MSFSNVYEYNANVDFDEQPKTNQQTQLINQQPTFNQNNYVPIKLPNPQLMGSDLNNLQTFNNSAPIKQKTNNIIKFYLTKYLIPLILFLILYIIFSLDFIKNTVGNIISIINPDDEGYVSIIGCAIYGLIIGFIFVLINAFITSIIDKFM